MSVTASLSAIIWSSGLTTLRRRNSYGSIFRAPRQFVHRALDRENRLRHSVAADRAGRHHVGVNGIAVDLLVRTAIDRDRFAARRVQGFAAVIAVGAGVGNDPQLHRRQSAIAARTDFHLDAHRMTRSRGDELLFAGELQLDRTAGLERG